MSKAAYWQRGETLDYKNQTDTRIDANTIIPIGERIGVAGTDILPGELGSLHVTGVFEMPKTDTTAIEQGASVYFDGTGITATESSSTATASEGDEAEMAPAAYVLAGYAAQDAAAEDTVILVKLVG